MVILFFTINTLHSLKYDICTVIGVTIYKPYMLSGENTDFEMCTVYR